MRYYEEIKQKVFSFYKILQEINVLFFEWTPPCHYKKRENKKVFSFYNKKKDANKGKKDKKCLFFSLNNKMVV